MAIVGTGHLSLELGGPRQFGPHGPDPDFDRKAVEWLATGDLERRLAEVTLDSLPSPGNAPHGFLDFMLTMGVAGAAFATFLAIAIGLVLLTLLPLGLRASGIVMLAIPLSLAMGLTGLYWLGFTVHQLSIVGVVIALGLLVDDAIIAVEMMVRKMEEGMSRFEAAETVSTQSERCAAVHICARA